MHRVGLVRFVIRSAAAAVLTIATTLIYAQSDSPAPQNPSESKPAQTQPAPDLPQLIARGVEHILQAQEGQDLAEWPYEGVYRVRGEIPIGYRIGGTAICAMALIQAPGYSQDQPRQEAVFRAASFIIDNISHPLMNPDYEGGYDVRGWGYTYGLTFLLRMKSLQAVPDELREPVEATITFFIQAIQQTEITQIGGWNYARAPGRDKVSPPSPFMTAPTLQALFEAAPQGYEIDQDVVARALDVLEQGRTLSGSFRYSGGDGKSGRDAVPGATGRMLVSETTLYLAGRSSLANIRSAVDAFIVHWPWLDKRRAQPGTHMPPYGIAPYYFYYAHYYAAQAVELLPEHERGEYRRRINDLLISVQLPNGTWNDRVFERSSNYGSAMSVMALMMPQTKPPAKWAATRKDEIVK